LLRGSETCPEKRENELVLLRAEMTMVVNLCGVKLSDKVACEELRERLGLEDVVTVLQHNRLRTEVVWLCDDQLLSFSALTLLVGSSDP